MSEEYVKISELPDGLSVGLGDLFVVSRPAGVSDYESKRVTAAQVAGSFAADLSDVFFSAVEAQLSGGLSSIPPSLSALSAGLSATDTALVKLANCYSNYRATSELSIFRLSSEVSRLCSEISLDVSAKYAALSAYSDYLSAEISSTTLSYDRDRNALVLCNADSQISSVVTRAQIVGDLIKDHILESVSLDPTGNWLIFKFKTGEGVDEIDIPVSCMVFMYRYGGGLMTLSGEVSSASPSVVVDYDSVNDEFSRHNRTWSFGSISSEALSAGTALFGSLSSSGRAEFAGGLSAPLVLADELRVAGIAHADTIRAVSADITEENITSSRISTLTAGYIIVENYMSSLDIFAARTVTSPLVNSVSAFAEFMSADSISSNELKAHRISVDGLFVKSLSVTDPMQISTVMVEWLSAGQISAGGGRFGELYIGDLNLQTLSSVTASAIAESISAGRQAEVSAVASFTGTGFSFGFDFGIPNGAAGPQGLSGHTPVISASRSGMSSLISVDGQYLTFVKDGAAGPQGLSGASVLGITAGEPRVSGEYSIMPLTFSFTQGVADKTVELSSKNGSMTKIITWG